MKRGELRLLMRDWDEAGMLPETLFNQLWWLFSITPPSADQVHLAAFHWWLRNTPRREELMGLAVLLRGLPLHTSDKLWVAEHIRMAKAFDASVEAILGE